LVQEALVELGGVLLAIELHNVEAAAPSVRTETAGKLALEPVQRSAFL